VVEYQISVPKVTSSHPGILILIHPEYREKLKAIFGSTHYKDIFIVIKRFSHFKCYHSIFTPQHIYCDTCLDTLSKVVQYPFKVINSSRLNQKYLFWGSKPHKKTKIALRGQTSFLKSYFLETFPASIKDVQK